LRVAERRQGCCSSTGRLSTHLPTSPVHAWLPLCWLHSQSTALQELRKRFEQQEHQLEAATASAASTNETGQVQVEPYFPEEKVQQELSMLHKVRVLGARGQAGGTHRWLAPVAACRAWVDSASGCCLQRCAASCAGGVPD
jgi:hypothetical protein